MPKVVVIQHSELSRVLILFTALAFAGQEFNSHPTAPSSTAAHTRAPATKPRVSMVLPLRLASG